MIDKPKTAIEAAFKEALAKLPAYDRKEQEAALKAARSAGYSDITDYIEISNGQRSESLRVLSDRTPYVHLLVRCHRGATGYERIEVFRNDDDRTLDRSLDVIEEVAGMRVLTRGLLQFAYRGIVRDGPGKGEEQIWALAYEP